MPLDKFGKVSGPQTLLLADLSASTVDPSADYIPFINGAGVAKKELLSAFLPLVNGIAYRPDDDPGSIFTIYGEHDFHGASAVDTDLGALGVKATFLGGYFVLTQAFTGTTTTTASITVGSAASDTRPISNVITITKANTTDGLSNCVGTTFGLGPVAAGVDMLKTVHIYVYTEADAGPRTGGKARYALFFQKSA
jgi:hypothetical protein